MHGRGCGLGIRAAAAIFTSVLLAACANLLASPAERATMLAAENGFHPVATTSGLRALLRHGSATTQLTIYIEGDGAHWRYGKPPRDPTPVNPLALKLAIADAHSTKASVAYVARACQFLSADELADCPPSRWTDARFSAEAVAATIQAIDVLVSQTNADHLTLVGYSGGGALAALVAARSHNVRCLVTVGSPLDTDAWTSGHKVSPLVNSLNPATDQTAPGTLSELHFQGGEDRVVPAESTLRYQHSHPRARFAMVTGYDHECCWEETWAQRIENACG